MRLPYSWAMRVNTRSAPVRSTRMAMPGYFASNDLAIFSASGKSTEVYQTTLPSFFAASISSGVTTVGSGATARIGDAKTLVAANAVDALTTSRLENDLARIGVVSLHDRSVVRGRAHRYHPTSARHRSGGRWMNTLLPRAMLSPGEVTMRSCMPS